MKIKNRYTVAFLLKKKEIHYSSAQKRQQRSRKIMSGVKTDEVTTVHLFWQKKQEHLMKTIHGKLRSNTGKDLFSQCIVKSSTACCDCWEFVLKIYKYPNIPRHAKPEGSIKALQVVNENNNNLGVVSLHTCLGLCSSSDVYY